MILTQTQIKIKDITIEDREIFLEYYKKCKYENSEANFTNMFIWKHDYNMKYAIVSGFLIIFASYDKVGCYHHFPVGEGNIVHVINELKEYYTARCDNYSIRPLTNKTKEILESEMSGVFEFEQRLDYFDYVYSVDKLISLEGKALGGKRNHLRNFLKNYQFEYKKITPENMQKCCDMVYEGIIERSENSEGELRAMKCLFDNYEKLGVKGAFLEVDNKVVAVTIGEEQHGNALIHLEKADTNYKGAYAAINQMYLDNEWKGYKYVNREEDLGIEGLRRAKQSYHPEFLIEKYIARPKKLL